MTFVLVRRLFKGYNSARMIERGMIWMNDPQYMVAIVGAGPAGLYAARKLAEGGAGVVLFNRDIKPGGLAEYGIYPDN